MTGTAITEVEEFNKIYGLEVMEVPTNRPLIRQDLNDRIYKNEDGKYQALAREIKEINKTGQPILVGTVSIEKNELIAELLEREGVEANILNAKHHDKEAHIIAQAGKVGAVTVATNMAGRGVDVILGGHPFDKKEYDKVKKLGGLCVLGTERHESRRIDNQLRGRAGRQGDPGVSQFYISMDDDVMRIFGSDRMKSVMNTLRVPDDMPIENRMISKSIEGAQKKVEGHNFDIRKHLVSYDDVMNKQRATVYKKRRQALEGKDSKEMTLEMVTNEIDAVVRFHTQAEEESLWNLDEIYEVVGTIFPVDKKARLKIEEMEEGAGDNQEDSMARSKILGYLTKLAVQAYNDLEEKINMLSTAPELGGGGPNSDSEVKKKPMRYIEKGMVLRTIDSFWIDHLSAMQYLRTGIGLRGYGQRDPLVEYKREGFGMYKQLLESIDKQVTYSIFKIGMVNSSDMTAQAQPAANIQLTAPSKESSQKSPMAEDSGLEDRKEDPGGSIHGASKIIKDVSHYDGEKVGRNEPCPCGATKQDGSPIKFKNCHGK